MVKYSAVALAALLMAVGNAFVVVPPPPSPKKTSLNALPPLIIGPMIRRMREEKEKKNQPLVTIDEARSEAPGLRVGETAWKWPPIWPYDKDFFTPKDDIQTQPPDISGMANLLTGQQPQVPEVTPSSPENKFDPLQYWGQEKADVTTDLDQEAADNLRNHYAYYLKDGMSVLELGAAEESYLPDGLQLRRHVGVGANEKLMKQNPKLSETLVVDLNKVIEDQGVDSEDLAKLSVDGPFDAIIMANTVDFLTNPREVYKSAWKLLKPGGCMMVAFSAKDAYKGKFDRAQTRMWTDYNDDQHMWVCGSFFQFSAGEGWESCKGFDISPPSSKDAYDDSPLAGLFSKGKSNNLYVVQATRAYQDDDIDEDDPEKSFRSMMWMLPVMEERDKVLLAPRMKRAYQMARNDEERQALVDNLQFLPKIYQALIRMDQFAFGFGLQSQLATNLIADPDFNGSDEQLMSLKEGLGLRKPSEDFWLPVGQNTASMTPENKINLLAHIVPRFCSGNPEQDSALEAFVTGMKPTFEAIRKVAPTMAEADVQLVGTELLAAEVLIPGRSTREEFALWLGALKESELEEFLQERKKFKKEAAKELDDYKEQRAKAMAEEAEFRAKVQAQVEKAREERTVTFNTITGKFEELKK